MTRRAGADDQVAQGAVTRRWERGAALAEDPSATAEEVGAGGGELGYSVGRWRRDLEAHGCTPNGVCMVRRRGNGPETEGAAEARRAAAGPERVTTDADYEAPEGWRGRAVAPRRTGRPDATATLVPAELTAGACGGGGAAGEGEPVVRALTQAAGFDPHPNETAGAAAAIDRAAWRVDGARTRRTRSSRRGRRSRADAGGRDGAVVLALKF